MSKCSSETKIIADKGRGELWSMNEDDVGSKMESKFSNAMRYLCNKNTTCSCNNIMWYAYVIKNITIGSKLSSNSIIIIYCPREWLLFIYTIYMWWWNDECVQ